MALCMTTVDPSGGFLFTRLAAFRSSRRPRKTISTRPTTLDPDTDDVGSSVSFVQVSGAIPELSTWAMMLLGFAGLGYAGYRKAKRATVAGAGF